MKIKKLSINGVDVSIIDTDKFKSICGALFFKMPVSSGMVITRNLIKNILIHSCNKYPTNRLLNINCLENYDAYYSASYRRDGNYATNFFLFNVLDDRYTKDGNIYEVLNTFKEIIFNPNIKDDKFDDEEYDLAYQKYKTALEAVKERAKSYAANKLFEQMSDNTPLGYIPNLDMLSKITNEKLYKEYLNMINNSEISFVIAGHDVSKINLEDLLSDCTSKVYNQNAKSNQVINDKELNNNENYNGLQSVLEVGLKIEGLTDFESTYVMPVFNNILGSGASSRLFNEVREKNSLCYSCFSRYYKDDNIIEISAGIDNKDYEKALSLIKETVLSMENINDDEVKRAITDITSALKESLDEISNYVIPVYINKLYNEDDVIKKQEIIKKVTKEDLEKVFKKVNITDSFFLKGGKTSE